MVINDGFYRYKNVLKKQLKLASRIYLSIAIVLFPFFLMNTANASSVGGWSMGNPIAQGASTIYEGSKNVIINGADYVKKGTATITPTASNVAKTLGKGVAGVALSVAVDQLIGAVDWVLDPANNQIKWVVNPEKDPCTTQCAAYKTLWYGNGTTVKYATYQAAAPAACLKFNGGSATGKYSIANSSTVYAECKKNSDVRYATILSVVNPAYDPTAEKEGEQQKTIPLDSVAQQVISNANSGDTSAQAATTAAAADIVAESETDSVKARPIAQQLEASASTKPADEAVAAQANTATGESVANPETGASDLKLDFPVFCNWAPSVCEAAQVVTSFPQTLTDWWEAAKDWATSEPQQKDPENLEIEDLEIDASEVNLSASGTCPQDSVSFSVMGQSVTLDMPYQPVCDALNFFKPAVLLVGAVASVYIVSGVRTKEEDQA